ncbi:MAG: hypothetical protein ACI8ZB_000398 [Desulforhopalus sp.]|jgi:hypothetical protein
MKTQYTLDQIIDFEYFLHEDTEHSPEELHLRDRDIGLSLSQSSPDREVTNRKLISAWILFRQQKEFLDTKRDSPGSIFSKSRSLATTLISVKGLLGGLFAGWAFFAYAGTTPINVLQFLLFFVFSQLLLTILLFTGLITRRLFTNVILPGVNFHLLHSLGKRVFVFINKNWLKNVPGSKRESVRHAFGIIRSKNQLYGSLFYWPIFSLSQLFGITFNLGLLVSSFIKIVTSDLAFGWQSTLQLSNSAIEKMVHLLSLPWNWLLPPDTGAPTLSQIEGSHIILKDGIYHLTTVNLVAWWPFLLLCLLFYGLCIRIVFYISGRLLEKKSLAQLQFTTPQCATLLRRMRTPVVSTQAATEIAQQNVAQKPQSFSREQQECVTEALPQVLLIPDDIYEVCRPEYIQPLMKAKGFEIIQKYRFMLGYDEDQQLLEVLANRSWKNKEGVVIIMESWMVPLMDFLVFIKDIRNISTPTTIIEIALTGQFDDAVFSHVKPADMEIWRKKIEAIGDPYIHLAPITGIS